MDGAITAAQEQLDGEALLSQAQSLLSQGEGLVTFLEASRGHKSIKQVVDKLRFIAGAGGSQDGKGATELIEQLDTSNLLDSAESILTCAEARERLLNSMKNKTVDFLLEYIPAMSIPDFHGVSNDIEYDITDLDLTEFKLDRKNVQVTLLDDFLRVRQREQFLAVKASGVGANFKGIGWKYLQQYFPYLRGEGRADAKVRTGGAFLLLFFL